MANKKNKKKASQKSTAAAASSSKAEVKAAAAADTKNQKAAKAKAAKSKAVSKADAKAAKAKAKAKEKKNAKPGFFGRIARYFGAVKSEMRRVTWPSKKELINYSVVVCASLVVVGIVIALLDFVIGEGLFLVSGLRG